MRALFLNPHPGGIHGCLKPLPDDVKTTIDALAGTRRSLGEALRLILLAVARDAKAGRFSNKVHVKEGGGYLLLEEQAGPELTHCWRLLDYTPLTNSQ